MTIVETPQTRAALDPLRRRQCDARHMETTNDRESPRKPGRIVWWFWKRGWSSGEALASTVAGLTIAVGSFIWWIVDPGSDRWVVSLVVLPVPVTFFLISRSLRRLERTR